MFRRLYKEVKDYLSKSRIAKETQKKQTIKEREINDNSVHPQLTYHDESTTFVPASVEETAAAANEFLAARPKPLRIESANPPIAEMPIDKSIDHAFGTINVRHNNGLAPAKANARTTNFIVTKDGFEIDPEGMVGNLDNSVEGYEAFREIVEKILGLQARRPLALLSLTIRGAFRNLEDDENAKEKYRTIIAHFLFEGTVDEFIRNIMEWITKKFPRHGTTGDSFGSDDFEITGEFVRTGIKITAAYIPLNTNAATFHFLVTDDHFVRNIIFGQMGFFTSLNDDLWCLFRTIMHNRKSEKKHDGGVVNWKGYAMNMVHKNKMKNKTEFIGRFEKMKCNPVKDMYDNDKDYVSSAKKIATKILNLLFKDSVEEFEKQSDDDFCEIVAMILDYDYVSLLIKESNLTITPNSIKTANEIMIEIHAPDVKYQVRSITSDSRKMKKDYIYVYNYDGHAFSVPTYSSHNRYLILDNFKVDPTVYVDQLNGKTDVRFDNQPLHNAMRSIPCTRYERTKNPIIPVINKRTWVLAYDCETTTYVPILGNTGKNKVTQRLSQFTLARLRRSDNDKLIFQYYNDVIPGMNSTFSKINECTAYTTLNTDTTVLLDAITSVMEDNSIVYAVAHNGGKFDFPLIASSIRDQWEIVKLEGASHDLPVYIHKTRGFIFIFRDTMRMTGMSLANFCKSMGLPEELTKLDIEKEFNDILREFPESIYNGDKYKNNTWKIMNHMWNYNHIDTDECSRKLFSTFIKYSELDVISLMEAFKALSCLFYRQNEGLLQPELAAKFTSSASSVTRLLKRIFINKKVVGYSSKSMFDEFVHNSPGGRVMTNTFGFELDLPNRGQRSDNQLTEEFQEELKTLWEKHSDRLFYADVTSLYPTAMYFYKYPTAVVSSDEERRKAFGQLTNVIKKSQMGTDESRFKTMDSFISNSKYFYVIKFTYSGGSGIFSCIPQKGKVDSQGKLIDAIDHRILNFTEGVSHPVIRTHVELLSFLVFNKGSISDISIDDVEIWEAKPIFKEIIAILYDKRVEYKNEGNKMEAVIKLMMNSLYGKLLQSVITITLSKNKPEGVSTLIGEMEYAGQKLGVWYNAEYQQHSVHLGMAVLAYSKYYVNRIIDCLGGAPGNIYSEKYPVFSGDTDSFMVYESHLDQVREYLRQFKYTCYKDGKYVLEKNSADLGAVHYDKEMNGVDTDDIRIIRYLVVAPKTYLLGLCGPEKETGKMMYKEVVTAKGISKKVIDDDFKINFTKYTEIGVRQYPKLHNTTFKRHAKNGRGGVTEEIADRSLPQISSIYESRYVDISKESFGDLNLNRRALVSLGYPVYLKNKHVTVSANIYVAYRKKFKPIHYHEVGDQMNNLESV